MSKDIRALGKAQHEADVDARLRVELQEQQDDEERAERVAAATKAKASALTAKLHVWKNDNISSASSFKIDEPAPTPIGARSHPSPPALFFLFCADLPLAPSPRHRLTFILHLGSAPNLEHFPRNFTRLDAVRAFLTDDCVNLLAHYVTSSVLRSKTAEQLRNNRHYYVVTTTHMWSWILQRLQISTEIKVPIKKAYKEVQIPLFLLHL